MFKTNVSNRKERVIGIIAPVNFKNQKPLGRQTNLIKGFFKAAEEYNVSLAIFQPVDLLNYRHPPGVIYKDNQWITDKFDRPAVIYDRYYSSMAGLDPEIHKLKLKMVHELKMTFLNPLEMSFMATDKIQFSKFMESKKLRTPEILASEIVSGEKLWELVSKHQNIILKPRFGRMGRGIIRLSSVNDCIHLKTGKRKLISENQWNLEGMIRYLASEEELSFSHYIVQKEIQLPESSPRYFDCRILVQRFDGKSKPVISGEVARLGGMDAHVPNIDSGGLAMPLDVLLEKLTSKKAAEGILASLHRTAFKVFETLEDEYGHTGEVGMDFLVDENYDIHVIEINSKPGRIAFERLASGFGLSEKVKKMYRQQRIDSIANPIRYAAWLESNMEG